MIINDLDLVSVSINPPETDSPLIVDANAVLSGAISFQTFEAVAVRKSQVLKPSGTCKQFKLSAGDSFDRHETTDKFVICQPLSVARTEGSNHAKRNLSCFPEYGNHSAKRKTTKHFFRYNLKLHSLAVSF